MHSRIILTMDSEHILRHANGLILLKADMSLFSMISERATKNKPLPCMESRPAGLHHGAGALPHIRCGSITAHHGAGTFPHATVREPSRTPRCRELQKG